MYMVNNHKMPGTGGGGFGTVDFWVSVGRRNTWGTTVARPVRQRVPACAGGRMNAGCAAWGGSTPCAHTHAPWQALLFSKFGLVSYTFADVSETQLQHLFHTATMVIRNKATGEVKSVSGNTPRAGGVAAACDACC